MVEKKQGGYYIHFGANTDKDVRPVDYLWSFIDTKGKKHTIKLCLVLQQEVLTQAQAVTEHCRSMSTTEMGIEQSSQELVNQLQAAIFSGEKDKARTLIEQAGRQGSFYSREWQVYHPLLAGQCAGFLAEFMAGIRAIAQAEQLTVDDLVLFFIAFVQNLTYGGQDGVESPVVVLAGKEGACAARAYLLTLLLRGLGKDCKPFGSQDVNHMMVGLVTQAGGSFVEHQHKKYYLIETTAPGFKIGQVDKKLTGDLAGWQVIDI